MRDLMHLGQTLPTIALIPVTSVLALSLASCGRGTSADDLDAKLVVSTAPLTLPGVEEAIYNLAVHNAAGDTVWSRSGLSSSRFGDGRGALTYVGPCDASANPNVVSLELVDLVTASGELDWQNPAPPGEPLAIEVDCVPNADTAVQFNLTILRSAGQGFFDIGVDFDDVFCSAKLDCRDESGAPLRLLHNPGTGGRDLTAVMALACTTGPGSPTFLHRSDLVVECANGAVHRVRPTAGLGNQGPRDGFFQTAIYAGREGFDGMEKCYWNVALGLDLAGLGPGCTLRGMATAMTSPWPAGGVAAGAVWPVIDFSVPLTTATGELACGRSPLNGPDGLVSTRYLRGDAEALPRSFVCANEQFGDAIGESCGHVEVAGVEGEVWLRTDGDELYVNVGSIESGPFAIPDGLAPTSCETESQVD